MSGQERRSHEASDSLSQERASLHGPAHRVDPVSSQAVSQPAHVRLQQGGPQEKSIKVQPHVPVKPGAQIEVALPGTGKGDHPRTHHVMVTQRYGSPQPEKVQPVQR